MTLFIKIPIKTLNEANLSEHWTKRAKRRRIQRFAIQAYLNGKINHFKIPCRIKITRIAPNKLDYHDGLPCSMKSIVDQICDMIVPGLEAGRSDDKGFKIEYDQKQGLPKEYAVEVEITNLYHEIPCNGM